MFRPAMILLCAAIAALAAGCGSSSPSSSSSSTPPAASSTQASASSTPSGSATTSGSSVGALSAEAKSAATGDIPDTQAFLTYANRGAGYSLVYPEGWTRKGSTNDVTFSDKNNVVHIVVARAGMPTAAGVAAELNQLRHATPSLTFRPPTPIQLTSGAAVKATYTTLSAPNPVTGKGVRLVVDRYEFAKAGKRATVDLGTPKGVDNVDAYRRMINSFRWR
jgi:hypothetical protein